MFFPQMSPHVNLLYFFESQRRGSAFLNSHTNSATVIELQTCIIPSLTRELCGFDDGILLVFLHKGTVDFRASLPCVHFLSVLNPLLKALEHQIKICFPFPFA